MAWSGRPAASVTARPDLSVRGDWPVISQDIPRSLREGGSSTTSPGPSCARWCWRSPAGRRRTACCASPPAGLVHPATPAISGFGTGVPICTTSDHAILPASERRGDCDPNVPRSHRQCLRRRGGPVQRQRDRSRPRQIRSCPGLLWLTRESHKSTRSGRLKSLARTAAFGLQISLPNPTIDCVAERL